MSRHSPGSHCRWWQ